MLFFDWDYGLFIISFFPEQVYNAMNDPTL